MKTLKIKTRFSLNDISISLAMFCVVSYSLLENVSVSIPLFSWVKMPLLYMGGIFVLTQIRVWLNNILKRKYFYVLLPLLFFCVMLLFSMYINRNPDMGISPVRATVRLILYLMELFALTIVLSERGASLRMINFLFFYMLVLAIITDFFVLTGIVRFNPGKHENYLIGTKFSVSYLHMNLLVFWVMRRQRLRKSLRLPAWIIIVLSAIVLLVSIYIDCMAGVLGCVALVGLFMMMESQKYAKLLRFSSPVILLLSFIISVTFSFVAKEILNLPFVIYLLENVFGRNATLTGRLNIYLRYVERIQGHWLAGFGLGNGNAVSMTLFGYANAQNAILYWVLQVGIPTTCTMLFYMLYVFHRASLVQSKRLMEVMPLIILIYVYVILGMIEITFDMNFFLWFAMIFLLINENRENNAMELE